MHRLRVRTLLIIVAPIAVGLALAAGAWRKASYRAEAARHAGLAREYKHRLVQALAESPPPNPDAPPPELLRLRLRAAYHEHMAAKYRELEARPWQFAGPDPQPPR